MRKPFRKIEAFLWAVRMVFFRAFLIGIDEKVFLQKYVR